MSVTILEALQNAEYNLTKNLSAGKFIINLATSQLHNAIILLDKGYDIYTLVEPLLEKYGGIVENVPEKEDV